MTLFQWFQKPNLIRLISISVFMLILNACGSSSTTTPPAGGSSSTMTVKLMVDPLTRLVTGEATVSGFTATALHIHQGAVGVNGSVLVALTQDPADANRFVTPDGARFTADQYTEYLAGSTYFNSHSAANPSGEVREQIAPATIDISNLTINGTTGATSGYAMITGFTATVAHIHTGFAGESGGVSVALEADGTIAGRFNAPAAATVTVSDYNAGKLYVNVHSADFSAGHIRQQIVPAGLQVIAVEVSGSQSVPTAVSDGGSATAYITVNETTGALDAVLNLHNIDDSTNTHIHDGVAGVNGGVIQGFTVDPTTATTWTITGATLTIGAGNDLEKLLAGGTYVNVHTTSNGAGEARGQVLPEGVVMAIAPLTATEAQTAGSNASGASAGTSTGYVTVNKNLSPATVKANLIFSGITPTAAHIHTDTGGGVVQGFTLDVGAGTGVIDATLSTTEVSEFETDILYINLHTTAFAGGELRGQLTP